MLSGEISLIEGCVRLYALSHDLVQTWHDDPDFLVFGVVASDTDHLPTGSARKYWSSDALAREDLKIAAYEAKSRADILAACQSIVSRFSDA